MSGILDNGVGDLLADCTLCPRLCHADRVRGMGFCGGGLKAKVALVSLHPWEEPVIAGEKGAGTVFFSGCSLRCMFCQNHEISHGHKGIEVSDEYLRKQKLCAQANWYLLHLWFNKPLRKVSYSNFDLEEFNRL